MYSASVILLFVILALGFQLNFGQLTFFVVGDWGGVGGSSTKLQQNVASAMVQIAQQTPPSFILTVGDNFYDNGVTSTTDPLWQTIFENIYTNPLLQVPWYPVLGNRDYYGNTSAQIAYTNSSNRWYFPSRNYQFIKPIPNNNGTVQFIMLDSYDLATSITPDPGDTSAPPLINQNRRNEDTAFVLTSFQETSPLWKVLVTHYPMYSAGSHGPVLEEFEPQLAPLLADAYPDVYFAGHDHSLQHIYNTPIHTYIVGGSGTKTASTWVPANQVIGTLYFPINPNTVQPETGGFVSVTVTDVQMVVTIYSRNAAVLHTYTHYPQTPLQSPTSTPPPSTPTAPSSTPTAPSSSPTASSSSPTGPSSSPTAPSSTPSSTSIPTTPGTSSGELEQPAASTTQTIYEIVFGVIGGLLLISVIVLVVYCVKTSRVEAV